MNKLIIIGAVGHSKVIQDIVKAQNKFVIYAILDDAINNTTTKNNIVYSNTNYIKQHHKDKCYFVIAIGDNHIRNKIVEKLALTNESYATVIHPSAVISESSKIKTGTVIMPNAVINAESLIGNHCIISTNATIEHDNKLNDYVHISPGSTLSGGVSIGEKTHLGSGSVVIPSIKIGSRAIIGAGAVVTKDIPNNVTAVGVPAKIIKE